MARDFQIAGEVLVKVKGGGALSIDASGELTVDPLSATGPGLWELGLSEGPITVSPQWRHFDKRVDDFGPDVPAELFWQLAQVYVDMTLIHYDTAVLDAVMACSMAGGTFLGGGQSVQNNVAGTLVGAGTPQGGGAALFELGDTSGNQYISLNLLSPVQNLPWHFPTCLLSEPPYILPLGTEKSAVRLRWRVIPYREVSYEDDGDILPLEPVSAGAVLWDHELDTA